MAGMEQRTVFISYRRVAPYHARAVYQHLSANGYDVFMDVERMDSGAFDEILLRQIAARAHFVLLLTPNALDRCVNPNDWLRREIEHAIDMKRNIVPVTFEGFSWEAATSFITGKMSTLNRYSGVNVPSDYFEEAMARLRTRYLNIDVDTVIHPTPASDLAAVKEVQAEVEAAPLVSATELLAVKTAMEAGNHSLIGDYDTAIALANDAIRLDSKCADGYYYRGISYDCKGDTDHAISDYSEAIRLDPQHAWAYFLRGCIYSDKGDYNRAIADCNKAITLDPNYTDALRQRAEIYRKLNKIAEAEADEREAERLEREVKSRTHK
jgi:tetratricopeptide (TPR) repeat protein